MENKTTDYDRTQVKELGRLFGARFSFVYVMEGRVFMEFEFDDMTTAHTLANELLKMDVETRVQEMEDYISVIGEI
jgi:hypothetical protein